MLSQYEIDLREGRFVKHPTAGLKGKAKQYSSSYWGTWCNVVKKLEDEGYKVGVFGGPKGGTTTKYARFYLYLPSANDFKGRGKPCE